MHLTQRLCSAGLVSCLTLAAPAFAQTPPGRAADVVVNMHDVELQDVAQQISRITGRTLILDPTVHGMVNVVSAEPLTAEGVWDLFLSVLRVQGFAAVRSGTAWRIVPQAAAVQGGGIDLRAARPQDLVTSLIRLHNLPSDAAARVFKPLVASFGAVEALTHPNAIVVTDYADNVRRIERLALALDTGGGTGFDSIVLHHASARDVAQSIQRILGDETSGGPRVAVDERSNVLVLRGEATSLAEARRVAELVDVPGGAAPVSHVFRLNNNDAETITEVLRGLMGGGAQAQATNAVAKTLASNTAGTTPGQTGTGLGGFSSGSTPSSTAPSLGNFLSNGAATVGSVSAPAPSSASSGGGPGFSAGDVSVQSAPELNAIVVRGPAAAIESVGALIAQLDVRRPQVMIEAAIVEITGDLSDQLGVQLGTTGAAPLTGATGVTSFTNTGVSLPAVLQALGSSSALGQAQQGLTIAAGRAKEFSILVQALGTSSKANLLSTPSITTLDNQAAQIVVGQNVPFVTGSFTTSGNNTDPFTTIERQDVGITLKVTPRIHEGDVVRLDVSQEVSSIDTTVTGASDIVTDTRSIQTTVLADDGQTIVLGGLISDDRMSARNQVPVLGDIPVLGQLFKSETRSRNKRTLFVFLRPTIIRDAAATTAAAQAKYDRLRKEEEQPDKGKSLLLAPPTPRLGPDIKSIY